MEQIYKRGEIVFCELGDIVDKNVQAGDRPALIIQNNIGNEKAPTTVILPLSKKVNKKYPFHVQIEKDKYNLKYDSIVLCEQPRTINKGRITRKISKLDDIDMGKVDYVMKWQLSI